MSALAKFSQRAARSYLQSAVFIDDKIYTKDEHAKPNLLVDLGPQRKRIYGKKIGPEKGISEEVAGDGIDKNEDPPFHAKEFVGSFAREGITCALYEPEKGFSTDADSEVFKLCLRPDIVILDWDFSTDGGTSASNLVRTLVKFGASELPHHSRLIAIYTTEQSLIGVVNQLADRLRKEGLEAQPQDSQYRLNCGATRIVVFGKPVTRFGDDEEAFTVKEKDLAKRLIDEFVKMNTGILPAFALHGLASIRRNTKRILDRFHGNLDGAFLFHRKLIAESEEAFDQLPELLADEIRAVVEDERIKLAEVIRISANALKSRHISDVDKELIELLKKGANGKKTAKKLKVNTGVPAGHLSLAALFCNRTQYSTAARQLSFGTLVKVRKKYSSIFDYAVCLVPACDSLRLKTTSVLFPFWTIDVESFESQLHRNGMILESDIGQHVALSAGGKAGEKLWTESFSVDSKTKTVVAQRARGSYKYSGCKKTVEWVGQLKPLHAHRIARSITESLSRVGVSEAEWIRLFCDRE